MSSLLQIPRLLLMLDIESLDLGPRPTITQIAMLAYDLEQDEFLKDEFFEYLPAQPQMDMKPTPRTVSFSTLWFWFQQPDESRLRFENNLGDDLFDVQYIMKSLVQFFNKVTNNGRIPYVVAAKGPQFDFVAVETLLEELDLEVPWDYNMVDDLRTMLRHAKIDGNLVPKPEGFIKHVAYWDSRYQVDQYLACQTGVILPPEEQHDIATVATGLPDASTQRKLPGMPKT